ncbi:sigma-70 family RNA polymerase sigma factor [Pseudoflavonifractor sp. 524-17]|nr:sigma-70 family RNA polymerase sigma factor [Pseudoflavonifractor sp. 524-17]
MRQYTGYVAAVAGRVMGSTLPREDLEEVVADVFLSLWTHAGTLEEDRSLRPWLAAAARNRAVDKLRRAGPALPLLQDAADPNVLPQQAVERRERSAALAQAIDALPEPDRSLFLRYYYEGQPLHEAARSLGLNLSTAKTKLARGRARLKKALQKGGFSHA